MTARQPQIAPSLASLGVNDLHICTSRSQAMGAAAVWTSGSKSTTPFQYVPFVSRQASAHLRPQYGVLCVLCVCARAPVWLYISAGLRLTPPPRRSHTTLSMKHLYILDTFLEPKTLVLVILREYFGTLGLLLVTWSVPGDPQADPRRKRLLL